MRFAAALRWCVLATMVVATACKESGSTKVASKLYHVGPSGSATGDGSAARPWDLQTGLGHPAVVAPNDTLIVHGGTYTGAFVSSLAGGADSRIVIRAGTGERVIIDGNIEIRGQYTVYIGFEVLSSNPTRETASAGADPADYKRPTGVVIHGPGTRIANFIVHDAGTGVGLWAPAVDAEVYGSILYNNGWQGPDRGYGFGIAAQNREGTKRFIDNIIFQQFNGGVEAYGSDEAPLSGFTFEGNISFDNGLPSRDRTGADFFIGGGTPAERVLLKNNYTFRSDGGLTARFGYEPKIVNQDIVLADNYFVGETSIRNWHTATLTGNTFTGAQNLLGVYVPPERTIKEYKWSNNAYYPDMRRKALNSTMPIVVVERDSGVGYDYDGWVKATGHDGGGKSAARPSGTHVFVRPNVYERGRAHVVVYNWDSAQAVDVDLSDVLDDGDRYEIRHVYDLFGTPVATGTYSGKKMNLPLFSGKPVSIPLKAVARPQPTGLALPPETSSACEFAVFVVTRVGTARTR